MSCKRAIAFRLLLFRQSINAKTFRYSEKSKFHCLPYFCSTNFSFPISTDVDWRGFNTDQDGDGIRIYLPALLPPPPLQRELVRCSRVLTIYFVSHSIDRPGHNVSNDPAYSLGSRLYFGLLVEILRWFLWKIFIASLRLICTAKLLCCTLLLDLEFYVTANIDYLLIQRTEKSPGFILVNAHDYSIMFLEDI